MLCSNICLCLLLFYILEMIMHESCVLLSPRLHENVIQVLIVLICNQLYKEGNYF